MAEKLTHLSTLDAATRVEPTESDVAGLLREAVASRQEFAHAHGVELEVAATPPLSATVDETLVRRAVRELLVNAIRHAPPRSSVRVDLTQQDGHFEISVADRGPGIPEHDRARVMQPFERGDLRDVSDSSMGLGLAVVSAIAAAHGGTISLADNEPHGLVARLCLRRHIG